ncbi:transposase [Streptomyces fractus]|uniref:transposase n=1 Tax=Streptomyces fractus TaxID=641806 RepID=UPI003CEE13B2
MSPYDGQARRAAKGGSGWVGYLIQLTETCEPSTPNLITHVATTDSAAGDRKMTQVIQADLAARGRLPSVHLADGNAIDGRNLLVARAQGFERLGPVEGNTSKQTAGQYALDAFAINWDARTVTCPAGKATTQWYPKTDSKGLSVIRVRFRRFECLPCPYRGECLESGTAPRREVVLRPRAEHEAIRQNRSAQRDPAWRRRYQQRNGIEAAVSQGVRAFGMRRSRYRGQSRTYLQHAFTAAAMNLARLDAWTLGTPRETTRNARFEDLRPTA